MRDAHGGQAHDEGRARFHSVADNPPARLRLISDPAFVEGTPILFDLRQSDSNPLGQGPLLAAMWQDLVGNSRVAMVASKPETLAISKHLELIPKAHVRAFDNVEEARAWLSASSRRSVELGATSIARRATSGLVFP